MITLPSLERFMPSVSRPVTKPIVVVQWGRADIRYLVAAPGKPRLKLIATGKIEREADRDPIDQLAEVLKEQHVRTRRLVVLLSRADLEVATLQLPPTEEQELPEMVASLIEQEFGDSETDWIVDFTISRTGDELVSEVMAFSQSREAQQDLMQRAKAHQMTLEAVLPRGLTSVGLLRQATSLSRPRSVAISFVDGQIDLAVLERSRPIFLRSVRVATDDLGELARRSAIEIRRCLAATGDVIEEDHGSHIFVFGNLDQHDQFTEILSSELDSPVSLVNPIDYVTGAEEDLAEGYLLAPLLGAAYEVIGGKPDVDLMHPRQVPKPVHPARRWAFMGAGLAMVIAVAGYYLWSDRMEVHQELVSVQEEFNSEAQLANKMLEKVDDVRAVQAWMERDINWLDELRDLSERLPPGDVVTIRRFNGSSQNGTGMVNLSVQVSDPGNVAILENRLRSEKHSVNSNRVSEKASDDEYPWQFETRLAFERRSRSEYRPELEATDQDAEATAKAEDNEADPPAAEDAMPTNDDGQEASSQPVSTQPGKPGDKS